MGSIFGMRIIFFYYQQTQMGGGTSQEALVNVVNNMVADVFINISLYCNSRSTSTQTLQINCQPYNNSSTIIYEENAACKTCIQNIVDNQINNYNWQKTLWSTTTPSVQGSIDTDYQNVINEFVSCGKLSCKACSIENTSQSTVIQSVLNCAAINDIQNAINQQLTAQITQQLVNNQDMLSPLANMLGASTTNDVITNINNRITALITESVIANITQTISNNQNITVESKAGGTENVTGQTQTSAYNSVMNYLGQTNIFNNILQQSQWDILQDLINTQNTIDTLGNTIVKTVGYLSKLLTDIVGRVVFFVLILVGVIFLAMLVYIVTSLVQKSVQKKQAQDAVLKKSAETVPAFETF